MSFLCLLWCFSIKDEVLVEVSWMNIRTEKFTSGSVTKEACFSPKKYVLDSVKVKKLFLAVGSEIPSASCLYEFIRAGKNRPRSCKGFYTCVYLQILTLAVLLPVHMNKTLYMNIQKFF